MAEKKTILCTCDACGKRARCTTKQKGPHGWFFVSIDIEDTPAIALACSAACKKLPWKRVPAQRQGPGK